MGKLSQPLTMTSYWSKSALRVLAVEHLVVLHDADVGVESLDGDARGLRLGHADAVAGVDDLALQVGVVDDVEVDEPDGAHTGRGEVQRHGAAQPTGADDQHLGVEELGLALLPDLRDEEVAVVTPLLVGAEHPRNLEVEAGLLPAVEPPAHGTDVDIAQPMERARGQQRTDPAGAVEGDRRSRTGGGPRSAPR